MKPRLLTSILLFLSAYFPLFLILAAKDFDWDRTQWLRHPLPLVSLLVSSGLSVPLLYLVMYQMPRGNMQVTIKGVRDRSIDIINYTIPYMIGFFGVDLSKKADAVGIIVFLVILLMLMVNSKTVFLNPMLTIVGYHLFDIDYEFDGKEHSAVVLSRNDIKANQRYYLLSLTRFLYFVREDRGESNDATTEHS